MIAWYSRDRSALSNSISCCRETREVPCCSFMVVISCPNCSPRGQPKEDLANVVPNTDPSFRPAFCTTIAREDVAHEMRSLRQRLRQGLRRRDGRPAAYVRFVRMCDSRSGPHLRALRLSHRRPRCGTERVDLLLRALCLAGRSSRPEGSERHRQ